MKKNPYNFNEIPTELKALPQWILWRKEKKMVRQLKFPIKLQGDGAGK
ncbi:hypothetical protein AAHB63_13640 [Bacillus thuringiensis]